MITINYNRLFNLRLAHNYYEGGKGRGIVLEPTRDTLAKLGGGNMLFKRLPYGITVLYRALADEVTPMVAFDSDTTFTFSLKVENKAEFLNITNLDEPSPSTTKYRSGNLLYFSNDPASASIDPESPEVITHQLLDSLRNKLFTYNFKVSGSPDKVLLGMQNSDEEFVSIGKAIDGTPLPDKVEVARKDDGNYARSIDLRNHRPGKYTIIIRDETDSSTLQEEEVYLDDELATLDILGIVDIKYDQATNHLYGDTEEYTLQFVRKETVWKYFIVNKNQKVSVSIDDLIINDTTNGTTGYSDPTVYSGITFTKEGETEINGVETVTFKSDTAIPFYEIPNAFIKLVDDSDDSVLLDHLPNPSHSGVVKDRGGTLESEIYVFI